MATTRRRTTTTRKPTFDEYTLKLSKLPTDNRRAALAVAAQLVTLAEKLVSNGFMYRGRMDVGLDELAEHNLDVIAADEVRPMLAAVRQRLAASGFVAVEVGTPEYRTEGAVLREAAIVLDRLEYNRYGEDGFAHLLKKGERIESLFLHMGGDRRFKSEINEDVKRAAAEAKHAREAAERAQKAADAAVQAAFRATEKARAVGAA